jgi:hypothetical protein
MMQTQPESVASIQLKRRGDLDWLGATYLGRALHAVLQPGIKLCVDLRQVDHIDMADPARRGRHKHTKLSDFLPNGG